MPPKPAPPSKGKGKASASSSADPSTAGPSTTPPSPPLPAAPAKPVHTPYMFANYPVGYHLTPDDMALLGYGPPEERYTKKGKVGDTRRVVKYTAPPHALCKRCRMRPGPCWVEALEVAVEGGRMRNGTCHYCSQNGACETGTNNKHFLLVFPDATTMLFVHRNSLEVYRSQHVDERGRIHITQFGEPPAAPLSRAKSPAPSTSAKKGKGKEKAEVADWDLESEDWAMDPAAAKDGSEGEGSALSELTEEDDDGVMEGGRIVYYYDGDPSLVHAEEDPYGSDGYDEYGFDRDGLDKDGYNEDGFDKAGFDRDGYDAEGHDHEGRSSPSVAGTDDHSTVISVAQLNGIIASREPSVEYDDPLLELAALRAQKETWKAAERKWGIYDVSLRAENHDLRMRLTRADEANHTLIKRLQVAEVTSQKLSQRVNELSKELHPAPNGSEIEDESEEEGE
ncbi:uncharacterized protein LOC62_05G006796 [Vanrija pseudolonga]|uniref:Uncharacterized protein n=1 Tax=Vanrija pseudolonga TaxID=143232 RepID=A0AAF0YE95_9TREE|nr:hypothetical protein LOC62_05G006796 [Vanrija pseudolonga]